MQMQMETRALSMHDIMALLAVLVRDADEAGMDLTAKAVEFALSVAKSEVDTLATEAAVSGRGAHNVIRLPT